MTRFCPECGTKQRDENTHFCSNCGFDFSQLENKNISSNSSDDSIVVPIGSDDESAVKPKISISDDSIIIDNQKVSTADKPIISTASNPKASSSTYQKISNSNRGVSTNQGSSSSNRGVNVGNSSDGLFSNLSFNKCFLAFAILLILMVIGGLIITATQTEPTSDYGLTSFMNRSDTYHMSDYIDDYDSNDDSDSDYLSYGTLTVPMIFDSNY